MSPMRTTYNNRMFPLKRQHAFPLNAMPRQQERGGKEKNDKKRIKEKISTIVECGRLFCSQRYENPEGYT